MAKLNALKPFEVVCYWDPAIDHRGGAPELCDYIRTRDVDVLRFHEGKQPMRFLCRPIPNGIARGILSQPSEELQRQLCFEYSVYEIRNATTRDGRRGVDLRPKEVAENEHQVDGETGVPSDDVRQLWTDLDLTRLFDQLTILEVGEVIRTLCFFSPAGIELAFVLPRTSAEYARRRPALLAALTRRRSATTSSSRPASATTGSAPDDDSPGDATAMDEAISSPLAESMLASRLSEGG